MDLIDRDESLEIDFGLFLARDDWREGTRVAVLLVEAKTFGRFERKDLRRGAKLLDRIGDSIFVMATLRDALDDERDAIRRTVLARRTQSGLPTRRGRIIVLAANELAAGRSVGLRYTWTISAAATQSWLRASTRWTPTSGSSAKPPFGCTPTSRGRIRNRD